MRQGLGLELDARLIVDLPESRDPLSSFEAGQNLTEELLKQKRPFTALLAFDDMTAFGAIRALGKAGLRVPDDCSVIGFDDVAPSALCTPPLTTVRQPMEAMGRARSVWCWRASSACWKSAKWAPIIARWRRNWLFGSPLAACLRLNAAGNPVELIQNCPLPGRFFLDRRCRIKALFIRFNKLFSPDGNGWKLRRKPQVLAKTVKESPLRRRN